MATAEQIKSLIRSHLSEDDERFYTLALQVAAHEAHQWHGALAHDIREIIDKARRTRGSNTLLKFPQDLAGLVLSQNSDLPLSALVVPEAFKEHLFLPGPSDTRDDYSNPRRGGAGPRLGKLKIPT